MFIELDDIGVEFNDSGDPVRVDYQAPENNSKVLINADCILFARPLLLEDGNTITQICYRTSDKSDGYYYVGTSFGALKTLLNQDKVLSDTTVTPITTTSIRPEDSGAPLGPKSFLMGKL